MPGFPAGGGPEGDGALIPGPGPAHPIGKPSPETPWGGMGPLIIVSLDDYLSWYRDGRLKSDLGYMSPAQYRRSLGLAA